MAYVFEAMPVFSAYCSRKSRTHLAGKTVFVSLERSDFAICSYHMTIVDSFTISNESQLVVKCFVDNGSVLKCRKIK